MFFFNGIAYNLLKQMPELVIAVGYRRIERNWNAFVGILYDADIKT